MDNRPILVYDSGIGGLPYLKLGREQLPSEQFIYLADTLHFPYGEKKAADVERIAVDLAGRAIRNLCPKCIVVACNTASVIALAALRNTYDLPFIGVVPAVKPAALVSRKKRIVVLATQRTVMDKYLSDLITTFARNCKVTGIPANGLADFVEKKFLSSSEAERLSAIRPSVEEIRKAGADAVVLACTHFIHLEDDYRRLLGNAVRLVDSREGVIKQLGRIINQKKMPAGNNGNKGLFFVTDGHGQSRYERFAEEYGLDFAGILEGP
ncbi:MAG: glutamate racemase [Spirochaetales bacterium]|nr:glutamate racemase [Spirochaetales bacterium]